MRKCLAMLAAAVLIFGSMSAVVGKVQEKSDAKDGHHNAIVGEVEKINENNNVPYGQIKKAEDGNLAKSIPYGLIEQDARPDGTCAKGGVAGNFAQIADIDGQILGGHHNMIVVESSQLAIIGPSQASGTGELGPESPSLNQVSDIDSQICGGHHNLVSVDSSQIALAEDATTGDLVQVSDIGGQILGGHHNTIIVESSQAY